MALQTVPTISAMDLRKEPGLYLDKVDLRRESFIIERAGKAKAALVPLADLREMERVKSEARKSVMGFNMKIQKHFATTGMTEDELDRLVEKAIKEVRAKRPTR